MKKNIEIICVNYNTPELIEDLLKSYKKYGYDKYSIVFIDGSDKTKIKEECEIIYKKYNVVYEMIGYNIHHGPGLDYGINKSSADYILIIDSDILFTKSNIIEDMLELFTIDTYSVGNTIYVNDMGYNISTTNGIKYNHPVCSLINKEMYMKYDKFIRHGAPLIAAMKDINKKTDISKSLINFNINEYIFSEYRGTVNKFGYNL